MKKLCAVLAAAAIVCSTGVMAQNKTSKSTQSSSSSSKTMSMKQLDKNNDGYISRSEADANQTLSNEFAQLDTNKDGRLSAAEFGKHK
jgi:Ca2+-binding EF-hand superfamily protein